MSVVVDSVFVCPGTGCSLPRLALARLRARETDQRKDWAEKASTDLARRFDLIKVEDLKIAKMTGSAKGTLQEPGRNVGQKAGLNRGILRSGWGLLVRRLEQKAPDRVEKIRPAFTSQRCSACGQVDPKSRESQAVFRCIACGYACHAEVNAARNIAAGHAVTAGRRRGCPACEPRTSTAAPIGVVAGILCLQAGEDVKVILR